MKPEALLARIREDRSHGSTALALLAVEGVRELAAADQSGNSAFHHQLLQTIEQLQQARPSMVAIANLLEPIRQRVSGSDSTDTTSSHMSVAQICDRVCRSARHSQDRVIENMLDLIGDDELIMTHSVSSTISGLCRRFATERPGVRLVVTESRPGGEGNALARELSKQGLAVTRIADAQIDLWMPRVSRVVIGADAILANGSAINKVGSAVMALSANYHDTPFYVCAEAFKQRPDNDFILESAGSAGDDLDLPGVQVCNIFFERVPPEFITRWVS